MKTIIIPKGFQMAINQFPFIVKTDKMVKTIRFDSSCIYAIGEDQSDWNKLFGFSLGLLPHGFTRSMHYNSIRFGWRYNPDSNKIEVGPYYYVNGLRCYPENSFHKIMSIDIGKDYLFSIYRFDTYAYLILGAVGDETFYKWKISVGNKKKLGFTGPFFFGGNKKAPHKITIQER